MAMPGTVETQGALARDFMPPEIIAPQSAVGGGAPSPRNPKPAAKTTIAPILVVPYTMTAGMTCGSTSRWRIRHWLKPAHRAASMKAAERSWAVVVATTRAMYGVMTTAIDKMTVGRPLPSVVAI